MISWLLLAFRALAGITRSRASLAVENALLRNQLSVLQRERPRPVLRPGDRMLWIWLCRHWGRWRTALVLVQPATVLRWHREGYRRYRRRQSGGLGGRPRSHRSHISLIHRISSDHPEWGEDRIALDLWLGEILSIKGVPIPFGAPNAAAHIERFMGSLRPKTVLSGSWRARCSAAHTTITDSLRSSDPPADLVAGQIGPALSGHSPVRHSGPQKAPGASLGDQSIPE